MLFRYAELRSPLCSLLLSTVKQVKCQKIYHVYSGRLQSQVNFIIKKSFSANLKARLPFEVDTNITRDVLIFSNKNDRFYKLLTYFGCAQFAFWSYLALFSFQTLKDAPEEQNATSWWRRIASKEGKYKNGISLLCFAFG